MQQNKNKKGDDRVPTWLLLAIGSLEGFLGYGAQWLVVSKTVAPLPYRQMCVCLCLGGAGGGGAAARALGCGGEGSGCGGDRVRKATRLHRPRLPPPSHTAAPSPETATTGQTTAPVTPARRPEQSSRARSSVQGGDGVVGAGRDGGDGVGAVAGAGGGGVGAVHLREQLHLLQLLRLHQDPDGPHPAAAQRPLRRQGRGQGVRPSRRSGLRPRPHLAPPRHRLPRGLPRLRRAVARRLQDRRAAALLADVRLPLPRRQQHHLDEHRRPRHLHPQLPRQQGPRLRGPQGVRGPQHRDIHRPLLRALRRRPGLVPRHARRRAGRRLRRRHGVPPRGPRHLGRRGRRARVRGHQHARGRHRALPPRRRPHRPQRPRRGRLGSLHRRPPRPPRGPRRRARARGLAVLDEDPQGGQRGRRGGRGGIDRPAPPPGVEAGDAEHRGPCPRRAAAARGRAHHRGGAVGHGFLAALHLLPDGRGHGAGRDEQPGPDGRRHGLLRRLPLRLHDQHLGILRPHRLRHHLRALHQDKSPAAASVERGGAGADVRGVRGDGPRHAGLPLRRLRGRGHLLRRAPRRHGANGVGAVRAQVLRPHLQHPHPQPAARLLPLLGPASGAPLRRAGHRDARRGQHLRRRALLPRRLLRHGRGLRRRLRPRRAPQHQDQEGVRQDPRGQEGQQQGGSRAEGQLALLAAAPPRGTRQVAVSKQPFS